MCWVSAVKSTLGEKGEGSHYSPHPGVQPSPSSHTDSSGSAPSSGDLAGIFPAAKRTPSLCVVGTSTFRDSSANVTEPCRSQQGEQEVGAASPAPG